MKHTYLEVTYRKGRILAAYLYLPRRPRDRSARTAELLPGLLVDLAKDGRPIGIEVTSPRRLRLSRLNKLLSQLGLPALGAADVAPLVAA